MSIKQVGQGIFVRYTVRLMCYRIRYSPSDTRMGRTSYLITRPYEVCVRTDGGQQRDLLSSSATDSSSSASSLSFAAVSSAIFAVSSCSLPAAADTTLSAVAFGVAAVSFGTSPAQGTETGIETGTEMGTEIIWTFDSWYGETAPRQGTETRHEERAMRGSKRPRQQQRRAVLTGRLRCCGRLAQNGRD